MKLGPGKNKKQKPVFLSYFYRSREDDSDVMLKAVSVRIVLALAEWMWEMSERCCHGEVKVYFREVIKITGLRREAAH